MNPKLLEQWARSLLYEQGRPKFAPDEYALMQKFRRLKAHSRSGITDKQARYLEDLENRFKDATANRRRYVEQQYKPPALGEGELSRGQYETMLDLKRRKDSGRRFSEAQERYLTDLEDKFGAFSDEQIAEWLKAPADKLREFLEDPILASTGTRHGDKKVGNAAINAMVKMM